MANKKWLLLAAVVIGLDWLSKRLAAACLHLGEPYALLPGLNLTLVHNSGAAFGLLSEAGGWQRYFFIVLALGVSAAIIAWLLRLPRGCNVLGAALALVLGGALGNLWDRLYLGYVIDFFDAYYDKWHWPVFNVADAAITLGAALLIIDAIWLHQGADKTPDKTLGKPQNKALNKSRVGTPARPQDAD